jgi:hypothetical protein
MKSWPFKSISVGVVCGINIVRDSCVHNSEDWSCRAIHSKNCFPLQGFRFINFCWLLGSKKLMRR